MQLTKKDLITKLIDAARKAGNANPFALGFIAFDDLRMKLEGPMTTTGQEWYATHPNDPLGMKDILTVPDDIDYNKIVKEVFESLTSDGGLHLWVIPTEQLADVLKFLMCHPRFQATFLIWMMKILGICRVLTLRICAPKQKTNSSLISRLMLSFEYKDADTGLVVHRITLNERDFWFFVDEQQMKIADRRW